MKRVSLIVATTLALSLAAGCAAPPGGPARTPAYADGYKDGCDSGVAAQSVFGRYRKNDGRFSSEPQYAQGWSEGFRKCEEEQISQNSRGSR